MTEFKTIHGVKTAYRHSGSGNDVILLHGWGQNMDMMAQIESHLCSAFSVWNLDFPGFGESDDLPEAWSVEDYREFLRDFVETFGIEDPILIGHSFGCRVAIRYAVKYPVHKMCLTGAAGLRGTTTNVQKVRNKAFKAAKWMLKTTHQDKMLQHLQDHTGSSDYRAAKGALRKSFVKIVNDDLRPLLPQVKCPVLLVYGDQDEATPLWMGQVMEQEMPDAGLAVFEGDDHYAYWHQADRFNRVLDVFLKEDRS